MACLYKFDVSAMMHESLGCGKLLDFLGIVRRAQESCGLFPPSDNLVAVECYRQMKRRYAVSVALSRGWEGRGVGCESNFTLG